VPQREPGRDLALGARGRADAAETGDARDGIERDQDLGAAVLAHQHPRVADTDDHPVNAESSGQRERDAVPERGSQTIHQPELRDLDPSAIGHLAGEFGVLELTELGLQVVEQVIPTHRHTLSRYRSGGMRGFVTCGQPRHCDRLGLASRHLTTNGRRHP